MSQRAERTVDPSEVVSIIETKTLQVQGQKATVLKVESTNTFPHGFTPLGQACPDDNCMMAFYEEGPGNTERAIADHRRYLPEQLLRTGSNNKWSRMKIIMEGTPWFTLDQYNQALARSEQAEKRKLAKEKEKRKK